MNLDNIPIFDRLDFWYAQLYSWISKDPSKRKEVAETIIEKCTADKKGIESIVNNGKFKELESIEDKEAYIKFPELSFNLVFDNTEINCVAKIRINPCIRLSIFQIDGRSEKEILNSGFISENLKDTFRKNNIPLSENPTLSKENERIWSVTDTNTNTSYNIHEEDEEKLYIYDRKTPPFYSKIWVIIRIISKNNIIIENEIFKQINYVARKLCDYTGEIYLSSLGGAAKRLESPLHNIKIKSMTSSDKRLLGLMFEEDSWDKLLKELENNTYLNKVLNSVLTNLCEFPIENWKEHLTSDCVKKANWKLVKTKDAKGLDTEGLYTTRQKEDNTIISALFYSSDQPDYEAVYNILHGWGVDLSVAL